MALVASLLKRCKMHDELTNAQFHKQYAALDNWPLTPSLMTTSILNYSFDKVDLWREPTTAKVVPIARSIALGRFKEDCEV